MDTILLCKKSDGMYELLTGITKDKREIMDTIRKTLEVSTGLCKYRHCANQAYTDKYDYIVNDS